MFHWKKVIMKCPSYEAPKVSNMEKSYATEAKMLHFKASPVKEPPPIKPQGPPAGLTTVLFSLNNNSRAVHNKENSTNKEHDRSSDDEVFEDSGYLSLHNSQINDHHGEEEDHIQEKPTTLLSNAASPNKKTVSPKKSPSKCLLRSSRSVARVAPSTPVDCQRRATTYSLSSTPKDNQADPNLPILKFQRAVCEQLAKSYQKNKRYDWSIPSQVAEDHLLDRVIGGQMGLEFVDVFSALLSRNMRSLLTKILAMLSDMDLIRCKKVSRTWRKIISEDTASLSRCQKVKQAAEESQGCPSEKGCGLTRDVAVSRLVLSSMQTLASPSSSSSTSSRATRQAASSQKGSTPDSKCTRFNDYVQAANTLKQHESLRSCKCCGSPSTYSAEARRATCTRPSCQFDFCTRCQQSFHGSTPCREVQPRSHLTSSRSTQILPGSARSKRNIRRL
ncbi:F-box only protein 5-like [Xyrichtys novacula]|uniref:F-box only protein 5-like n=1 Tax=Xyrichtys novacula TaxID=13765 RepID=A0AAV1G1I7_XYRNO|nr:F-box only protein 5-like [Xyrichtys novacula]